MADSNGPDRFVEFPGVVGGTNTIGLLGSHPAGGDHFVETPNDPRSAPRVRLGRRVFAHLACIRIDRRLSRHIVAVKSYCPNSAGPYTFLVPKLWSETIETHRREVSDAILETAVALVTEQGLQAVTMSQIAEQAGIGRATLYKYFPGVEAILRAWHERQVMAHLERLVEIRDRTGDADARLEAVLEALALTTFERPHGTEVAAFVHRGEHLAVAERQLIALITNLLAEAANAGAVREDVVPEELARYCLNALAAAGELPSKAAVRRLVAVTIDGLRPR